MAESKQSSASRRTCLRGLAGAAVALAAGPARAGYCRDIDPPTEPAQIGGPPLGAATQRVRWGTAIEAPALYDPKLVAAVIAEAPKCLAIGSGVKFPILYTQESDEPAPERWRECDAVAALGAKLGIPLRADCLAWNDWLPEWVTRLAADRPEGWDRRLRHQFEASFRSILGHLAALGARDPRIDIRWCGLVNEPFNPWLRNGDLAGWRTGAWLDAYGMAEDGVPAYIHEAFMLATRYAAPGLAFFINEAHCDNDHYGPIVRPALLKLVDALQKRGDRVDAVGLESHLMPQWMTTPDRPDWRPFTAFLRELARRGVEIFVTELDVNDCATDGYAARDARVGAYMRSFVEAALQVPAVTMVTDWDFSDRYSWLRSTGVYPEFTRWAQCVPDPACPRPTIYDENMHPKPGRRDLFEGLLRGR